MSNIPSPILDATLNDVATANPVTDIDDGSDSSRSDAEAPQPGPAPRPASSHGRGGGQAGRGTSSRRGAMTASMTRVAHCSATSSANPPATPATPAQEPPVTPPVPSSSASALLPASTSLAAPSGENLIALLLQMQSDNNAQFLQLQTDNTNGQAELHAENAEREAALRAESLAGEANQEPLFNRILAGQLGRAPEAASTPPQGTHPHNPLFSSILELHPNLDAFLVKEIFNRTFKPENLLKLSSCSFYVPGSSKRRCEEITLGEFTIPTSNKEVSPD
jgi:hypothetical protein